MLVRAGQAAIGAAALSIAGLPSAVGAHPSLPTAPVASYDGEAARRWFRLALDLVTTTPGFSPPVASRALGYLGVTLYEALVPGMAGFQSLAGQLNDLSSLPRPHDHSYHWPTVANSARAATRRALFPIASPANQAAIEALETELDALFAPMVPPGIGQRSVARGQAVAAHVVAWSMTDGGHEGYLTNLPTSYTPPVGPGLWVPTAPAFQRALPPYWGQNRPFVLSSGAAVDPGPPPAFSTEPGSAFHAEALEVYQTVNHLTAEQRAIALF